MSNYWWWLILSQVTGSPLLAVVLLFGGGWAIDRFTLGILPSPLRLYRRWRRAGKLTDLLAINPHDRRARFELADLLSDRKRFGEALAVLKPNVEAGETDAATMYLMGRAAFGAGHNAQAETFLRESLEQDPEYRMGASYLELGRGRLAGGDWMGARSALEDFCKRRQGTVEGRVLLARAFAAQGDKLTSDRLRSDAWKEYRTAPGFLRRQERWWAWRLKPWRPIGLALAAALLAYGVLQVLPQLRPSGGMGRRPSFGQARSLVPSSVLAAAGFDADAQQRFQDVLALPRHPGGTIDPRRFVRLEGSEVAGTSKLRGRWVPGDDDPSHASRMIPGDMLGRIWAHYGPPDALDSGFSYVFRDQANQTVFSAYSASSGPAYGARMFALGTHQPPSPEAQALAEASVGAFDQLLDDTKPVDCSWKFQGDEGPYVSGVRNGIAFADDS